MQTLEGLKSLNQETSPCCPQKSIDFCTSNTDEKHQLGTIPNTWLVHLNFCLFVWIKTAEMFCFVFLLWTIFFFSWLEGERFYKIRLSIVESCQIVKSISCQTIRSMYVSRSPLPSLMLDCHCKYSSNDELVGDKKEGISGIQSGVLYSKRD